MPLTPSGRLRRPAPRFARLVEPKGSHQSSLSARHKKSPGDFVEQLCAHSGGRDGFVATLLTPAGRLHYVSASSRTTKRCSARTEGFSPKAPSPPDIKKAPCGACFMSGGEGGIRTLDGRLTHTPLAGERLQPLGHLSLPANQLWVSYLRKAGRIPALSNKVKLNPSSRLSLSD